LSLQAFSHLEVIIGDGGIGLGGFSLLAVEESLERSPSTQVTLGSVRGLAFSTVFDDVSS